jgi:hypothetical protein
MNDRLTAYNDYEAALTAEINLPVSFSNFDFTNTRFIEEVGAAAGATGTHQAFVFAVTPTDTHLSGSPEPGTLVMIAGGLLCLLSSFGFRRIASKRG